MKKRKVITAIFSVYRPSLFVTVPKPSEISKKTKFTKALRTDIIKTFNKTNASLR
jgi:hypothetical protein